ncbi:MAG: transglutaminase-like domain-containing protein [Balneolales bacterium]
MSLDKKKRDGLSASRSEIEALVYLYEDTDVYVRTKVEERLKELGERSVPLLDEVQSKSKDDELKVRFQDLIHLITFGSLEQEFANYLEKGVDTLNDLEKGIFLLSRFENPTLRTEVYKRKIDRMASEIETDIQLTVDPVEKMNILIHHIYKKKKFSGSMDEFSNPTNFFMHKVLDRKKGIPLNLALLVLFMAHRLKLPFEGVNMPMHFLLKYDVSGKKIYIDPYNKGNVISVDQCLTFLKKGGIKPTAEHFNSASHHEMLTRSIRNLIHGYEKNNETDKAVKLQRLLGLVDTMVNQ